MDKIVNLLRDAKSFLVTTHYLPDGDGLGAQLALHRALLHLGKHSYAINGSPTPEKFQLVDPRHEIRLYRPGETLPAVDLVVVMDTNDFQMLGPMEAPVRELGARVLFVDHHVAEGLDRALHLIDESYGSTGELVFDLLTQLGAEIDFEMATALYSAIITDTNHFRFKRTTSRSHRAAALLLEKGVQPEKVYQAIYAHDSLAKVRLLGHVLQNISSTPDGKIVWITIPLETRQRFGATIEDTESYVNQVTLMEKVDIGIVFREDEDGRIKISIRGNGGVPVYEIAKNFGGGGHRHAAGARLRLSLEAAIREVVAAAAEALSAGPA
jgi:phosphoesterase RecJ-like protein